MQAPARDTAWGPMQIHFEAAREAAAALHDSGFDVVLNEPNLPVFAPEGEGKRLAKKAKEGGEREWRGDSFLLVRDRFKIAEVCGFLRDELAYAMIIDVTAVDYDAEEKELWGVYSLLSLAKKCRLMLKVFIPKDDPRVPSVVPVYRGADWHEREAAEFFGIVYEGHPDLRNILLPDDWAGHPLRKDYEYPEEYHGISCV